jgi:hypothetical protein
VLEDHGDEVDEFLRDLKVNEDYFDKIPASEMLKNSTWLHYSRTAKCTRYEPDGITRCKHEFTAETKENYRFLNYAASRVEQYTLFSLNINSQFR